MNVNYFICTLGQAALPGTNRPFRNVNHLVSQQASKYPDHPAVGFFTLSEKSKDYKPYVITFREVLQGVRHVADAILKEERPAQGATVGLLCSSSPAFLFTWLGLIYVGHPVLLIAPQCSPTAIAHLSKACGALHLFTDDAHERLALTAVEASSKLCFKGMRIRRLPFERDEDLLRISTNQGLFDFKASDPRETDIAYLHHTSGTSSGMPKPIAQTHQGGVGVLPALESSDAATFTTTPLYHGGVADLFRAWTSAALIWLFPGQHAPITASNVMKCLSASKLAAEQYESCYVKYFSSVPYVLQMMAQDSTGLKELQTMDIVGVGGAALPPEVGDQLVASGVNLASRYGSAECGFIMSSHRDYTKEKDWQYLRKSQDVEKLRFNEQQDGLSELVIQPGWPHMAKTNREDGSFATSDLFAPHPTMPNTWKYHSRADAQLTLITGKKFDPAPLEGSLVTLSDIVSEVLIFGNGKPYAGVLLFRSEAGKDMSDDDVVKQIADSVEKINSESQAHARIPRNMLIPMPFEPAPLKKSSKGTVLRNEAEGRYHDQIEGAYHKAMFINEDIDDEKIPDAILKIIGAVLWTSASDRDTLTQETDLFSHGVDSVACVQIRHALMQMLPKDSKPLPLTVVEDCGTVARLSEVIARCRKGEVVQAQENGYQEDFFRSLVKKYSSFPAEYTSMVGNDKNTSPSKILLTGPTGLLGAHILYQLLMNTQVKQIYVLVRGASHHAAKERVHKALSSRYLSIPPSFDKIVTILPCKISDATLGLSMIEYNTLATEIDTIIHLAWSVNFLITLRTLATTHLAGLRNILDLALKCRQPPNLFFCSSIASVANLSQSRLIPESIIDDYTAAGPTGYSQSKLAAELICANCARNTFMRGHITIIRVGQLSGDLEQGVWNTSEAYPLLLSSSRATKALPDLGPEPLNWIPVDIAAKAYLQAAFRDAQSRSQDENEDHLEVLHLLNTSAGTTFDDLAACVIEAEPDIRLVSPRVWLAKLDDLRTDPATQAHPALKLLPFWQRIYGGRGGSLQSDGHAEQMVEETGSKTHPVYEMKRSRLDMPCLDTTTGALNKQYMLKLWRWVQSAVKQG